MDNHNNSITEREDTGDSSFILCSICHMTEEIYHRVNVRSFMTLNCGHSYCTRCIEQYLQLHAHRCRLCPMCRVPIEHVMRSAFMDEVANHAHAGTLRARTRGVRCPRCRLPMDETRTPCAIQPCGHMICTECRNERTCPTCSIPIHPTAVTIDYLAQQLLARNHEHDARTSNMSTLSTSEDATAEDSQDYGPHVRSMVELHDVVHKNLQHLSTWPAVDARDDFERACPAGVHQQIYNRLMQLTQEAVLAGATQEDFMALGLPTFIHCLVFPLMEQVTRCVEARRHRAWTRSLDVHIFCPRPALLSPQS